MHLTNGEFLGSFGVTLLLLAFLMNLLQKWKQNSLSYILLNIIGAGLSCASSVVIRFFPFVILEATWTLVSVVALIKYFKRS